MAHHDLGGVVAKKIGRGRLKQRKHKQLTRVCFTTNTVGFLVRFSQKNQKSILIRKTAKPFYNKSLIDQACSVKMAGYKPRSFFPAFTNLDFVSVHKKAKTELG